MYSITRQLKRHKNDNNPAKSFLLTINCSQEELISKVLYLLRRLASSENLGYRNIGSDTRVSYIVSPVASIGIDEAIVKLKGVIEHNVSSYNQSIKSINTTLKRANAQNKGADTVKPLIKEANLKEYLSPFVVDARYIMAQGVIFVEDNEG